MGADRRTRIWWRRLGVAPPNEALQATAKNGPRLSVSSLGSTNEQYGWTLLSSHIPTINLDCRRTRSVTALQLATLH